MGLCACLLAVQTVFLADESEFRGFAVLMDAAGDTLVKDALDCFPFCGPLEMGVSLRDY